MNPRGEPCRFAIGHHGRHSWDLTLKGEERAARAMAGRTTLSKAELMQAIGDAACRKLSRVGSHQVIAKFEYAPTGELLSVDVELIPKAPTESQDSLT